MDEKDRKPEEKNEHTKLRWETPKLYALKKEMTEGGFEYDPTEGIGYEPS
ncbi:MAG TPA: hypothetical protein VJ958_06370 [Atribacterota bacterium]|nr:hypothetical protein [Atribacterota bacterium]